MSCIICRRGGCAMWMHSAEEQKAYEKAGEAYERFLEIRERCATEYAESTEVEEEDQS